MGVKGCNMARQAFLLFDKVTETVDNTPLFDYIVIATGNKLTLWG